LAIWVSHLTICLPALADDAELEAQKLAAIQKFHHGKARQAIEQLRPIVELTPNPIAKANLERTLIEICDTASDRNCVDETLTSLYQLIAANQSLSTTYLPEANLYLIKQLLWFGDFTSLDKFLQNRGGVFGIAAAGSPLLTLAQLQITLHSKYIKQGDFRTGEAAISSAFLDLLLSDPKGENGYYVSKVLIGIVDSLIHANDIVGAFAIVDAADSYISRSLPRDSILFATYRMLIAQMLCYTNSYDRAVGALSEASDLIAATEISDDVKNYWLGSANSLASAALVLSGKASEARAMHARHPMQKIKEQILTNGEFRNYAEFYLALSDVFIDQVSQSAPDFRWKPLFEKGMRWRLGDIELREINSYRHFALGLLDTAASNISVGQDELITAAKERIDNSEAVLRLNSEGFPLISLVDKIILLAGLEAAVAKGAPDSGDVILRASELLNRYLRHEVADAAATINSQPNDQSRARAESFIHVVRQKREWELTRLKETLNSGTRVQNGGALINNYTQIVQQLAGMKARFQSDVENTGTVSLPTVARVQQALSQGEVFIAIVPAVTGIARLCIAQKVVKYSIVPADIPNVMKDVRLVEFSTSLSNPPDPITDFQFPVESAISLYKLLFGGLEPCLAPGESVTVALPGVFASIPLGALLDRKPSQTGEGYDLANASWLIRQFSFASVISARQFVALAAGRKEASATHPFLGIGDPRLPNEHLAQIRSNSEFRGAFRSVTGDIFEFPELPETREELLTVGARVGARSTDILLGEEATEEAFRTKQLGDYDVLHFATHGLLAQDIPGLSESALLLTGVDSSDQYNDGILSASEISNLSLQARLIVLSACNSAKYDVGQASLGARDLHAAFTLAGSPTLLASLWPVESSTARDLVSLFFDEWRSRQSGAAASSLAYATRAFLKRADKSHQHPRYWASFVVIGYGGITAPPKMAEEFYPDFVPIRKDGGDVVDVAKINNSLVLSMSSDWDGQKMASFIARRTNGELDWNVSTRQIGAGKIAVAGDRIYAAGYTTEPNPIPTLRQFNSVGELQWETTFNELRGYFLDDLLAYNGEVLIVAIPHAVPSTHDLIPVRPTAFLMRVEPNGQISKKVSFQAGSFGSILGRHSVMKSWGKRIFVAVNRGASMWTNVFERNIAGLSPVCWRNAATDVYEFDGDQMTLSQAFAIQEFRAEAMAVWQGKLHMGGEAFDGCSMLGKAAVYVINGLASYQPFWKDNDVFNSTVKGLASANDGLWVGLEQQRPLAVPTSKSKAVGEYNKRWGDDGVTIHEASVVKLSADGSPLSWWMLSAGLSVYLVGIEPNPIGDAPPIIFGTLGGMPAISGSLH
jgi:CHAT domain-containing protein